MNPFDGAITIIKYRKPKKQKKFTRGHLKCNCGLLQDYGIKEPEWHDDSCIIHKGKNK